MGLFFLFFLLATKSYAYTPGFKTIPLKKHAVVTRYYLSPSLNNNQKSFTIVQCDGSDKKPKQFCKPFSSHSFSMQDLEFVAKNLEKWDQYYLTLDISIFFGAIFKKVRSWVWYHPVGRVVGVLALSGELSDFVTQKKQATVYAAIAEIDQAQVGLDELVENLNPGDPLPKSNLLKYKLNSNKSWILLRGFDKFLVQDLLNMLGNT